MKNIKYLLILFVGTFIFTSCENNDFDPAEATFTPNVEVNIGFTDQNDDQILLEDGGTISFNLTLSKPLPSDGVATLKLTSSDGSITTPGVQEVVFEDTYTFLAGETEKMVTLTFADDMMTDSEIYTLEVYNFVQSDPSTEYYVVNGDKTRIVNVLDTLPLIIVTTVGDVDHNFTWAGASDLDCRIRNSAGADIDTGYSVTPGETVTLPANAPDGVYTFSIRPWSVADPTSDYEIEFVTPTATEVLMGTVTLGAGFWADEFNVLEVEKTTNGTEVSYELTQL